MNSVHYCNGYCSSQGVQTTNKENTELVPKNINGFNKITFSNDEECHVIINGKDEMFFPEKTGLDTSIEDYKISSFIIKESGINYYFVASY